MKNLLLALITLFAVLPLAAQQNSVTLWVTSQQNDSSTSEDEARIDNGSGFGVSLARHFTPRLSGELAVFRTSSTTRLSDGFEFVDIGDLEMMPVTAMLRWHFRSGQPLGMYIGGGIAHVMVDDIESAILRANGIDAIEVGDETTGIIGAGVTYDFSDRWGIAADARYMPLSLSGGPAGTESVDADLDPLMLSAGVRFRF